MKTDKVLIEKYKGFEIYYNKENERFIADDDKHDRHFEAHKLYELKGDIASSMTEVVDKKGIIKSGYFHKSLAKIQLLSINKANGRCKYKTIEDTEKSYDTGKIQDNTDMPKIYEMSEYNLDIYNKLVELEKQIKEIELNQQVLAEKLK